MSFTEILPAGFQEEIVGLIGGVIFFGSWMLQAWETRVAGKPIVSARFFALRSLASALMAVESLRVGSFSIFAVMAATLVLMLYNLWSALRAERAG